MEYRNGSNFLYRGKRKNGDFRNYSFDSKRKRFDSKFQFNDWHDGTRPPMEISRCHGALVRINQDEKEEDIPLKLLDPSINIKKFLDDVKPQDRDKILLISKVIIKASNQTSSKTNWKRLLLILMESKFISVVFSDFMTQEITEFSDKNSIEMLLLLIKLLFVNIPEVAYKGLYQKTKTIVILYEKFSSESNEPDSEILKTIKELKVLAQIDQPYDDKKFKLGLCPPDNFRSVSVYPTAEDLLVVESKDIFLRSNKAKGVYKSVDDYLDIQFRLMREDFIHSLREGLMFYLNSLGNKKNIGIRIYKGVSILNSLPSDRNGIIHTIQFDISRLRNIRWKESKRFLHGSLVCLSCDNFTSLIFATIVDRDPKRLSKGLISIKFERTFPKRNKVYTMIETTNLFESYKHVLVKLQETNEENLPMKKYFVYAEETVSLPVYLINNDKIEYKVNKYCIKPGSDDTDWPTATELNMDNSQFNAFKNSLRRELTIIQGPPGTGKTYLGLKICETLVKNVQRSVKNFGPILVVCYTNHALDQFLEGILGFSEKIVRIGARSKSEKLGKYLLQTLKTHRSIMTTDKSSYYRMNQQIKAEFFNLQARISLSEESLLKLDILQEFMIEDHLEYFEKFDIKMWLSGYTSYTRQGSFSSNDKLLKNILESYVNEEIRLNVRKWALESYEEMKFEKNGNFDVDSDLEINYINNERKIDAEENIKNTVFKLNNQKRKMRKQICQYNDDEYSKKSQNRMQQKLFRLYLKNENAMNDEDVEKLLISNLSFKDRWRLYHHWQSKYLKSLNLEFQSLEERFQDVGKQLEEIRFDEDRMLMMNQDIIGMTTTGAARYGGVLAKIKCKVIIVEEAAEVLESHIIGSLNPGCEHLILIGDHKQLRPNPNVYELAKKYKLDLSLFERLINNNLPFDTLTLQHRMRPEIAEIMRFIYENLENDKSVLNYPNVPGVNTNIFFFDHQSPETMNEEILSYSNRFEAEFIVAFCSRLIQNGIDNSSITILTLYSGQMFEFRKLMNSKQFEGVRVCVVDNYQGEENDIILLSLVRSNEDDKIGFLNIDNRICVCLSRAKHGLYVFGNFELLASKNQLWSKICQSLKEKTRLDRKMTLICSMHHQEKLEVTNANDFRKYPNGGCNKICNFKLNCGHVCKTICHLDKHEKRKCNEKCLKSCPAGHACRLECWKPCGACTVNLIKSVPGCNHKQLLPCHKKPESKDCKLKCERNLPCGHKCSKLCGEECNLCLFQVVRKCPECGNKVKQNCYSEKVFCNRFCNQKLACGHKCGGSCDTCNNGRLHIPCKELSRTKLICGHEYTSKCLEKHNFCREKCQEGCFHSCCTYKCGGSCIDCEDDCLWNCEHYKCTNRCYQFCNRPMCDARCNKSINCRVCQKIFECYGVCGEMCWTFCGNCNKMLNTLKRNYVRKKTFITLWTCGHTFECGEMDRYMNTSNENEEISPKKCPECQTVINNRSCLRYSNLMKIISLDIKRVQALFIDESRFDRYPQFVKLYKENFLKLQELFSEFNLSNVWLSLVGKVMENKEANKCMTGFSLLMDIHKTLFSIMAAEKELEEYAYIRKSIICLLKWLNPFERTFDNFELDQFDSEYTRINMLVKLSCDAQNSPSQNGIKDLIDELKKMKTLTGSSFEKLSLKVKEYISDSDKVKEILAIKSSKKGRLRNDDLCNDYRWCKCRRGHYYNGTTKGSRCKKCYIPK